MDKKGAVEAGISMELVLLIIVFILGLLGLGFALKRMGLFG